MVKIVHPEAGEALVPASAVPHWRRCGWEPAEPPGQAEKNGQEEQDRPVESEGTPRRTRASKRKEEE